RPTTPPPAGSPRRFARRSQITGGSASAASEARMPQEAEPTAMVGKPMKVTFVRSGRRAGARVQEWRSEATGRVHEVLEARSDRPGADLRLGDAGYLWFRGGRVHVTAAPAAPSGRG